MRFSWTLVFSGVFIAYILHSIYSIVSIYIPPKCGTSHCLKSVLASQPELHLVVGTTHRTTLKSWRELTQVASFPFPYTQPSFSRNLTIPIPRATRQNGTLHMYAFAIPAPIREAADPLSFVNGPNTLMAYFKLTQYLVPEAETFNLLNSKEKKVEKEEDGGDKKSSADGKQKKNEKPVSHLAKVVRLTMLSEPLVLPAKDLPPDFGMLIRLVTSDTYLPPLRFDKFNSRIRDFYKVNATEEQVTVEFEYSSASIGSMRMAAQFQAAMETMEAIGFTSKDLDEIKGVFSDTNVYLLALTMFIASIHLLFDFLAFKNDVVYWQKRKSTAGLSSRTILWRCFSQIVVFLYLMEEKSSMLIIIPSGIGALIEIWKVTKALKIKVYMEGRIPRIKYGEYNASEEATEKHDVESMRYLSYILYPLCICGAIYSLLYTPHKSWYSWTVQSMVNGVYAFGFLFMLPQLFINYRLKSVAHLPWRAFMYKAFNTFIDDIFAFIITMPTAHRVACFRDDIVFLIYLYQRWLYPVDKSRVDAGGDVEYEADADEGKPLQRSDKSSTASASDKKND